MAKYRMGGKIGKSSNGDLNHQGQSTSDFVSKMNKLYGGNKTNFGHMLDNFRKEYATSDIEHAITVDKDGFAHSLAHGGKHSVSPSGSIDNMFLIHNHPSDSNFSRQDLSVITQNKALGIVATGKSGDYVFIKKSNFNSHGFLDALQKTNDIANTFTVKPGESIEQAYKRVSARTDSWLKANADKYGYEYRYRVKSKRK